MRRSFTVSSSLAALVAAALLVGCKEAPPDPVKAEAEAIEAARAKAVEEAEAEDAAGPSGYRVTPEKLDAFVSYQRRMLEVTGTLVAESQRLMGRADGGLATAERATAMLAGKAKAEEEARASLGLTAMDVRMLGALATEIAGRRSLARSLRLDDAIAELKEAKARLGEARQEELSRQLASLEAQAAELMGLAEVRARWGDENVDRLLTREEALTKNYQDMLAQFAAPPRAGPPPPTSRDGG